MAYIDGIPIKDSLHTDFSTSSGVWVEYRHQLTGDYLARKGTGSNYHEFSDGTFREYNRKLDDLGISGRVYLEPYDAGLRYKGDPFIHNYTGVASRQGAYSTRIVGFGGPLMRVRRNSDNEEVDVRGDANGNISLSSPIIGGSENETFGEYVGTASGYCTTWYDQFNTGLYQNNLTQATAADQPMIVSGGSLITDSSGNASLAFDGSNHYLPFDTGFTAGLNISGYSAFIVFQANTTDDNQMVASLGSFADSNKRAYLPFINGGNMTFNYGTTAAPNLTANTNLNLGIVSADIARDNMRAFVNGTDLGVGALDNKSGGDATVALGGLGNSLLFGGKIGEFIFYQNDSLSNNMATIQDNINDHFSIY